jgi:hypothetical protein
VDEIGWLTAATLTVVAVLRTGAAVQRLCRTGPDGVSGASAAAWVAVNAAWVTYACWVGLVGALVSELCYLVGSTALLVVLHRTGRLSRRSWAWGGAVALGYAAAGLAGAATGRSSRLLELALTVSVLLYGVPALLEGLRAPRLHGLSAAALTVTVLDALAALAYSASSAAGVYLLYGVCQLAVTLPVLVRVLAQRGHLHADLVSARSCAPAVAG